MNTIDVKNRLNRCLPRLAPMLQPQARLAELALDSLDTVEFLCAVHEEFGVRLLEEDFRAHQTVAGLCAIIEERSQIHA